ncbi:MAG: putative addiction module antidote protein [Hyphomicrobium sp. 32-62-53]|nr:MAG: putative addiction module antidote protein [Hyphomicrobium sp. 12-62-95]OYX97292.1 MAG: putative addiction module antidote protein [Hyphomicrobium sp. 32-62-53]
MKRDITDFDPAEYLENDDMIAAYLSDALETQDPAFIADAIGVVARAKGMKRVAEDAGVSRESLYRALSANGNPEFGTVLKVLASLNIKLIAQPDAVKPQQSAVSKKRRCRTPYFAAVTR